MKFYSDIVILLLINMLVSSCVTTNDNHGDVVSKIEKNMGIVINHSKILDSLYFLNSVSINPVSYNCHSIECREELHKYLLNNHEAIPINDTVLNVVNNLALLQIYYETQGACFPTSNWKNGLECDEAVGWIYDVIFYELSLKKEEMEWFHSHRLYYLIKSNKFEFPYDENLIFLIDIVKDSCEKHGI